MVKSIDESIHGVSSAAREIRRSEKTVRELFDSGRLRGIRDAAGRRLIPADAIQEFLAREKADAK